MHKIYCETCDTVVGEYPKDTRLYRAVDSGGNEHIVPKGYKAEVMTKIAAQGLLIDGEWERLPNSYKLRNGHCGGCEKTMHYNALMVMQGGMFYECTQCNQKGAVPPSPLTLDLRKQHGYEMPDDKGVYPVFYGVFHKCSDHIIKSKSTSSHQE